MKYVFLTAAILLGTYSVSYAECRDSGYNGLYHCLRQEDKADFEKLCNEFSDDMLQIKKDIDAKRDEIYEAKQSGQYQKIKLIGRDINQMERSYGERRKEFHIETEKRFKEHNPLCFK